MKNNNKKIESKGLILLLVAGIVGAFFMFNKSGKGSPSSTLSDQGYVVQQVSNANAASPVHLEISGDRLAQNPLRFSIKAYNKKAKYIFDFGDGKTKKAKGKVEEYAYGKPGKYKIKLIVEFEGESRTLHSETIIIMPKDKLTASNF